MVLTKFHQVTTKLVPQDIELLSPKELSQYYIEDYQLVYFDEGIYTVLAETVQYFAFSFSLSHVMN